ncbi:hypothetical protein HIM_05460 [Hirsutella minnesotensis 3608]|uniref:F-box domain-containing protein n=1 Tax=Hirsutella minnesotensis 3608 TaxID=1043627 RepID=A0A0F7ZKI1_9HYPO|nr:hypothetical protein HIM_05460 [Hirsutella minnesotensis 3608]
MASTSLADLPRDLLFNVLDLIPFADLRSLSTVNKHIRALTEPRLYSAVKARWALHHTPPVVLLLRSILDRPELCRHIRALHLEGEGFRENRELKEPPAFPLPAASITKASELILSTGVPHARLWINELQSGTVDAVVATLLATLPNLTSLHLDPNFTVKSRLVGKMLTCALCEPLGQYELPTFRNLNHVTFSPRAKEYRHPDVNNTTDVLPLFYLPKIQFLTLSMDNPTTFAWPAHTPAPSSLTSLEIYRLREARIGSLLSVLGGLKRLHWHWFYSPALDQGVSNAIVELDTVATALNRVRDTLTDLTIEAETQANLLVGDYDPPELEIRGSLNAMAYLGKLRRLCIPWVFLMGFSESSARLRDPLPPSLELLILTGDLDEHDDWEWDDDSIISAMKSELENQALSLPANLRRIILPVPLPCGKLTKEMEEEIKRIGANANLELEWSTWN